MNVGSLRTSGSGGAEHLEAVCHRLGFFSAAMDPLPEPLTAASGRKSVTAERVELRQRGRLLRVLRRHRPVLMDGSAASVRCVCAAVVKMLCEDATDDCVVSAALRRMYASEVGSLLSAGNEHWRFGCETVAAELVRPVSAARTPVQPLFGSAEPHPGCMPGAEALLAALWECAPRDRIDAFVTFITAADSPATDAQLANGFVQRLSCMQPTAAVTGWLSAIFGGLHAAGRHAALARSLVWASQGAARQLRRHCRSGGNAELASNACTIVTTAVLGFQVDPSIAVDVRFAIEEALSECPPEDVTCGEQGVPPWSPANPMALRLLFLVVCLMSLWKGQITFNTRQLMRFMKHGVAKGWSTQCSDAIVQKQLLGPDLDLRHSADASLQVRAPTALKPPACLRRPFGAPVGMANIGNTCFLSAVLQALYHTDDFRSLVLSAPFGAGGSGSDTPLGSWGRCPLLAALGRLFGRMAVTRLARVSPAQLRDALPVTFQDYRQHDSAEFARALLQCLHTEVSRHYPKGCSLESSLVSCFSGRQVHVMSCGSCGSVSSSDDVFLGLELLFSAHTAHADAATMLNGVLENTEAMAGGDQYACDECETLRPALRSSRVTRLPRQLMLSIGRFRYDQAAGINRKLTTPVAVPADLHVPARYDSASDASAGTIVYSLHAVIVHAGSSAEHGHYYCLARTTRGEWYELDDTRCSAVGTDVGAALGKAQASGALPYQLFYGRADARCEPRGLELCGAEWFRSEVAADDEQVVLATEEVPRCGRAGKVRRVGDSHSDASLSSDE